MLTFDEDFCEKSLKSVHHFSTIDVIRTAMLINQRIPLKIINLTEILKSNLRFLL